MPCEILFTKHQQRGKHVFCWFGVGFYASVQHCPSFRSNILCYCDTSRTLLSLQCSAVLFSHFILCGNKMGRLIKGQEAYLVVCFICGTQVKT